MKKNLKKILVSSIVAFACSIGIFRVSQGWFDTSSNVDFNFSGSSLAAYFAGGDGSESKPFIITNPRHLYNLAWLQYLGRFNEQSKTFQQYHFELGADIDMNGFSPLPPIGTALYPFIGSFSGTNTVGIDGTTIATDNQKTYKISNLKVSNKFSDFTIVPYGVTESNFKNCQIIGTFGVIGDRDSKTEGLTTDSDNTYGSKITTSQNYVKDLYLDNVKITTTADKALAGLLAGYVNGNLSDSGVHYGTIDFAKDTKPLDGFAKIDNTSKITKYSLIGDYNADNVSYTGEPGAGWGGSLNVKEMRDRIRYIAGSGNTNWVATVNSPANADKGAYPQSSNALPFVVSNNVDQSTYTGLGNITNKANVAYTPKDISQNNKNATIINREETADNNIGYLTGADTKILGKKFQTVFGSESKKVTDPKNPKKTLTVTKMPDFTFEDDSTYPSGDDYRHIYNYGKKVTDFNIYTSITGESGKDGKRVLIGSNADTRIKKIDEKIKQTLLDDFNANLSSTDSDSNRDIYLIRLSTNAGDAITQSFTVPNITVQGTTYDDTGTFTYNGRTYQKYESYLPSSSLWFVPNEDGVVKLVLCTMDEDARQGFSLIQVTRNKKEDITLDNPYSIPDMTQKEIESVYWDKDKEQYVWNETPTNGTPVYQNSWARDLEKNKLYYFEIPVKGKTEYALAKGNGQPYLMYLDLGQNGNEAKTNELKNIDFVDKNSTTGVLTKVISNNHSDVVFSATMGNGQTVFYYRRKENVILYFIDGGGTLTKAGSGTASAASDYQCTTAKT